MATGGMGDVLSGITAAMICHDGIDSLAVAACAAVYLHGAAGDYCARHIGPYGFTATEVASAVPKVLAQWDEARPMPALQEPYKNLSKRTENSMHHVLLVQKRCAIIIKRCL